MKRFLVLAVLVGAGLAGTARPSQADPIRADIVFIIDTSGSMGDDIAQVNVNVGADGLPLFQVLKQAGLTGTTSEAMRMVEQGGVRINGERAEDKGLVLRAGETVVLQVGKRKFASVVLL